QVTSPAALRALVVTGPGLRCADALEIGAESGHRGGASGLDRYDLSCRSVAADGRSPIAVGTITCRRRLPSPAVVCACARAPMDTVAAFRWLMAGRYGLQRSTPFTGRGGPLTASCLLSVSSAFGGYLDRVTVLHMAVTPTPASRAARLQRSKALLGFGALLCAFVVVIHVADQGGLTAMADPPYKGYLFYALEIGGTVAALMLITRRAATGGWVLALGVSIGPASGYILSRSIGLPHYADDIGNWLEPL